MNDITAFNNCMSVFWRQHEAELSFSDIKDWR